MRAAVVSVLAVGGFYIAVRMIAVPLMLLAPARWSTGIYWVGWSAGAAIVAALIVYAVLLQRGWVGWHELRWPKARAAWMGLSLGVAMGGLMAAFAIAIAVVAGGARVRFTGESIVAYAGPAAELGAVLLLAALAEELVFRGYPLARLARTLGKTGASVLLAVAFALAHVLNSNVSVAGLANIALAALVLSAVFFGPGGLPAAWGLHFGWNAGLSLGADAPVSGMRFELPAIEYASGPLDWVSGGEFGPEGGVTATVAFALGLLIVSRRWILTEES